MNKNSLFNRIISSILALVMILGVFTAFNGIFSGVKAERVNPDGSITYGASDSAIVMNKDAWLEPDGTYAIDLTAYTTGQKNIEAIEFDAPTDFIIVVEQNCLMVDYYCYNDCYNYMSMATYKLAAAKSIARALVDEIRGGSSGGVDHRVGIIGYGGYSCYTSYDSNTGLFDNTGRWYNYRFSFGAQYSPYAQNKYGSTLVHVNTNEGYDILKSDINKFNTMTSSMGGYTDAGLEMAKGVINATKNDSYQAVDANGNVTNVPRKKVVVLISDGTPGYEGFDMKIAADAVNVATEIKKNLDAKIFTVTLSTELEEQITAYDWRGRFFTDSTHADAVTINKRAYNPQYGKGASNQYNSTIYSTLKFNYEEFFTRDFTSILSSAYPCTESSGPNGPITGKYMTNRDAYSLVGQGSSGIYPTNRFPMYYRRGSYATYLERNKSIGYFYKDAYGSNKLITGLYDNNVRNFNNRIPYNFHPVDKIADPAYGKYYIRVNDPKTLVNGYYSSPNYDVPTASLKALISKIVSEIPEGTSYSGSFDMNTIGEAYIKDIISDYFFYHDSFDPAVNVKTFTQNAIGYQNGEYVFSTNIVPYSGAIVKHYDDVVTVAGFDYDANTCYRDTDGIHGKKFIVQIRGLRAKSTTVGDHLRIANTPGNISGLYAVSDTNDNGGNGGNGGGGSNNGSVAPITSVDLKPIKVVSSYYSSDYPKPAVLEVTPANADYTVTWYVSDTAIANVDEYGYVKAMYGGSGSTTLNVIVTDKITGREYRDSADVTIIRDSQISAISSVDLQPMTVVKGSYKTSNLIVNPSNTHFRVESWRSSNSDVADVGFTTGMVTGVSEGTAIITAWLYDYEAHASRFVTAPVTVVDGSTSGGTNPNPNPNPNPSADKIIVHDGDEAIFPVPYVNIREKSIVYDFSLKIQDDDALTFFETDASTHDVRHVLSVDQAYIQQDVYHEKYPYAGSAKFDAYKDHFEVGISELDRDGNHVHTDKNCHAYVNIKSMSGEKYDAATLLELTSTRRDIITGEMKTVYEWCRVYFLPATNVHFEESLLSFTNANGTKSDLGAWTVSGTANGPAFDVTTGKMLEGTKYNDAHQATANNLYGHDAEYHNAFEGKTRDTHGDSNGRAMTVTVNNDLRSLVRQNKAQWPTVEFTFRGNEIDLISRTGINTGVFGVDIVPVDKEFNYVGTSADSAHMIVDTYYKDGLSYQTTVFNYSGLNWGEYKVKIRAMYAPAFDHQTNPNYVPTKGEDITLGLEQGVVYEVVNSCDNPETSTKGSGDTARVNATKGQGSFDCYIDAIRVYNPLVDQIKATELEKHEYYAADEHNPEYSSIRERLISAGEFIGDNDRVSGIVYIDTSDGTEVSIADYKKFGPKYEAWITPGNGFAFSIQDFNKETDRLHISAKSPNAKDVGMLINNVKYGIDSATELFFDITNSVEADGRVVIACEDAGSNPEAILALCQIKLVSGTKTRSGDRIYVDRATLQHVDEVNGIEFDTLLAPRNVKPAIVNRMPSITWDEVQGAARYQVWRMPAGGTFELAATVTETSFKDTADLTVGTKYYYKVRAIDAYNNVNAFSGSVNVTIPGLAAPKSPKVKVTNRQPVLSWKAAAYAESYEIWRMAEGGEFELLATVSELSYTDASGISGGTAYSYKIRSVDARGYVSDFTAEATAVIPTVAAPTALKVKLTNRQPVLSWKKAAYAVGYQVWRMIEGGEYELVATTTALKFTDTSALIGGQNCTYKVRAIDENGAQSVFSAEITVTIPVLAAPTGFAAKISSRKPVISWKKVAGAVGYQVWRMEEGGNFELIDTVTTVKYTDTSALNSGSQYTYKVRAIDMHNLTGIFTEELTVLFPELAAPTRVKAVVTDGAPVITWRAVSYATGYAVYRSTSATECFEFAGVVSAASFTDEAELEAGVRYYYKVVALDDFGNASAFSAVVSAVIPA